MIKMGAWDLRTRAGIASFVAVRPEAATGIAADPSLGVPSRKPVLVIYAGEMIDPYLGWCYSRARWYDPATGRFNRTDPFAGNHQYPQSLHKYLYAHKNPGRERR